MYKNILFAEKFNFLETNLFRQDVPLPPPLALWRQFQSMARVDRVMGDAAFDRLHRNRAGG
jgi:hypothetical protein